MGDSMGNELVYSKKDVCELLGISHYTLEAWYRWEKYELEDGVIETLYLPQPVKLQNEKGRPYRWSVEMVEELRMHKASIVKGRNGRYGRYTCRNQRVGVVG